MDRSLNLLHSSSFVDLFNCLLEPVTKRPPTSCFSNNIVTEFKSRGRLQKGLGVARCDLFKPGFMLRQSINVKGKWHVLVEDKTSEASKSNVVLHVQTLRKFPVEKLDGEVVIVRIDSALLLEHLSINSLSVDRALSTIIYLHNAGAKVLLMSNWGRSSNSSILSTESLADRLSSLLQVKVKPANGVSVLMRSETKDLEKPDIILLDNLAKFREELANCPDFSKKLSSGAYIFVNDNFSLSHKILASTVGIARFCCASIAGFHFEEEMLQLTKAKEITRRPYVAIIGGSNLLEKAIALHLLASVCDGLIFVGRLAFQIMHALGLPAPSCFLENDADGEALKLVLLAHSRGIPIYFPHDFWCINNCNPKLLEIFSSDGIMAGWTPVDLGPDSLKEISSILSKCQKVLWIGQVKFSSLVRDTDGGSELALMLERMSKTGCDVTIVGNAACKAVTKRSSPFATYKVFKTASVVWEFLKGRTLPGVAALDRAYSFDLDWYAIFTDPTQPLTVDIGSGNGLFLSNMAKRWNDSNFLGLEMNNKLVSSCLDRILASHTKNGYFISTNATSNFRSILASYPGDLALVSIQCPNPDFNREEHRWRMVQRILVEDITDLLVTNGKVFLQSDIKAVATRMKEQFMKYGKGLLVIDGGDDQGWLPENPFGIRSDWEQHVLDRGAPMYRLMLRKGSNSESSQ